MIHPNNTTDTTRQSAWYLGNCVANLISGVVVYGIGSIEIHTIANWQLIFLFLGAITTSLAFWLVSLLPDSPKSAIFLSATERAIAVQRTLRNKTGVMDTGSFKWNQALMALKDPQMWFLVLYTFSVCLCNGGVTTVCFQSVKVLSYYHNLLTALVLVRSHQWLRIFPLPISAVADAIGSCPDYLPCPFLRRDHLCAVNENSHDDPERRRVNHWHDSCLEVGLG